jgi:nucleoside-diphosphate-sugar epimerase
MKILVTGGCGYKGHQLVPRLLLCGHNVVVVDAMWFGNYLADHQNLEIIKQDIRSCGIELFYEVDVIIHLASVANDPCSELNPKLTWEVNALATMRLADFAVAARVKQFIYASSGSVYGVNDSPKITEDLPLNPISDYNKTKMISERILLSYSDKFKLQILRPATVCGYSDRMRFDVAVNLLTIQALTKGKITVLGGDQIRPNVHIRDIVSAYIHFIDNPELLGIFNIGFENFSIKEIANKVVGVIDAEVDIIPSNDPRSYRIDSTKLLDTGFEPKSGILNAIKDIQKRFEAGTLKETDDCHNLLWMKKNRIFELGSGP